MKKLELNKISPQPINVQAETKKYQKDKAKEVKKKL